MMEARDYLGLPLGQFLDALAAATPEPGGGSVAALAVALAAGLCEMAAGLSAQHLPEAGSGWSAGSLGSAGSLAERAQDLRAAAAPLAQADAEAYRAVLAARRAVKPGSAADGALAAALSAACDVPMRVAEIGAEVAGLAAALADGGNPSLCGDAITAALLAAAGAQSAAALIQINLAGLPQPVATPRATAGAGDDRPARVARLAARAARRAAQATRHANASAQRRAP